MQPNTQLKQKRESFSRSIRKSQIQKIQKLKRQKQMRITNPLWSVQKLKEQFTSKAYTLADISQDIDFLITNIASQSFASIAEQDKIIQSLLVLLIDHADPWIGAKSNEIPVKTINNSISSLCYPEKSLQCSNCKLSCECMDISDTPTEASQNFSHFFYQDVQIDGISPSKDHLLIEQDCQTAFLSQNQTQWIFVFYNFIDLLESTLFHYLSPIQQSNAKRFCIDTAKLTKFHLMFMNTIQMLQFVIFDLIQYGKDWQPQQNMTTALKLTSQQPERMNFIIKIVSFLSKIGKVSYLNALQWPIIFQLYFQFISSQTSEVKHVSDKIIEIKQMLAFLTKSIQKNIIFRNYNSGQKISRLLISWAYSINTSLRNQYNLSNATLEEIFQNDFELFLYIMSETKFLQKDLNDEAKKILQELLKILRLLEQNEFRKQSHVQYIFISPRIIDSESSQTVKNCKKYIKQLIKILYEQMQLSESDLHRICENHPYLKQSIEQMVDADTY